MNLPDCQAERSREKSIHYLLSHNNKLCHACFGTYIDYIHSCAINIRCSGQRVVESNDCISYGII